MVRIVTTMSLKEYFLQKKSKLVINTDVPLVTRNILIILFEQVKFIT